jgi:hypothetical protein
METTGIILIFGFLDRFAVSNFLEMVITYPLESSKSHFDKLIHPSIKNA